jgi:DeoR/GlpR family transcriptional regulator of sugar metabolism
MQEERVVSLPAERQKKILNYVLTNGSAVVKELVDVYGVSEATVRRDLDELNKQGQIERTHGGAIAYNNNAAFDRFHNEKMTINTEEKKRIGTAARALISEGDTILLDSGTTTFAIAQGLAEIRNITLITNDIFIASNAAIHPTSKLVVTGGLRMEGYYSMIGSCTEQFIKNLWVNKVFLGTDGIHHTAGVTNSNFWEVSIKCSMLQAAERKILVADSDKFDKIALVHVFPIKNVDMLITDTRITDEQIELYNNFTELKVV